MADGCLKADRDGKAKAFADTYAASTLKGKNDEEQDGLAIGALRGGKSARASMATLKELSVKEGTVTPAWWAIKTLLKVRACVNSQTYSMLKLPLPLICICMTDSTMMSALS